MIPGALAASGALAKGTPRGAFERHGSKLYGEDKYYEQLAAFKAKKDVAALAGSLPPLKSEKAPKSFAKVRKAPERAGNLRKLPARESASARSAWVLQLPSRALCCSLSSW